MAAHELDLQAFDLSGDGLDLNTGKISYQTSDASDSNVLDSADKNLSYDKLVPEEGSEAPGSGEKPGAEDEEPDEHHADTVTDIQAIREVPVEVEESSKLPSSIREA